MTLPGTQVISRASAPSGTPPVDTGTCFAAGLAERGPTDVPVLCRNLAQVVATFGPRVAYGYLYDFADVFFREGGSRLYLIRAAGPAAAISTINLADGAAADTLQVDAVSPGAWGDDIDVDVTLASGEFVIEVTYDGELVETSPSLATNAEAVVWAESSDYIRLTDLGEGDPATQSVSLAGGDDDQANITDTEREAAIAAFAKDLGPGQVVYPGATTTTIHQALLEHAEANNRVALLDLADTATVGTLTTAAGTSRALDQARYGAAFTPWAIVPGTSPSTTRTVPYSAVEAGIIARNDGEGLSPNVAAAGERGISRYATGLSQDAFSDADRETLHDAGVNVARLLNGAVRTYGYRSLVNPLVDTTWLQFNWSREAMALAAEGDQVLERFLFEQVDGRGRALGRLNGELRDICLRHYAAGALFGSDPGEAFDVVTDDQVNPPEQLESGEVRAAMEVRISPHAERVVLEISKTSITESL